MKDMKRKKPYSQAELVTMDEAKFRQMVWLVSEIKRIFEYEEDAKRLGLPTDPYAEGVNVRLTRDGTYERSTGIHPTHAWYEIGDLLSDLISRGYLASIFGPTTNSRGQVDINLGDRASIDDERIHDLFELLAASKNKRVATGSRKKQSDSFTKIKEIFYSDDPRKLVLEKKEIIFKNTNAKQAILVRILLSAETPGKWIDKLDDGVEESFPGRALNDTARTVNGKIMKIFRLKNTFIISDYPGGRVRLNTDTMEFKIIHR